MRKQYLHLSAYSCDRCSGPVVAGSLAVRENEISKETDIRQVGAACLSCGHRQFKMTGLGLPQQFPPIEWDQQIHADVSHVATAFEEMLNHAI
jgi:DNA-directed RNA polymerase subunit RPC12/RpoP